MFSHSEILILHTSAHVLAPKSLEWWILQQVFEVQGLSAACLWCTMVMGHIMHSWLENYIKWVPACRVNHNPLVHWPCCWLYIIYPPHFIHLSQHPSLWGHSLEAYIHAHSLEVWKKKQHSIYNNPLLCSVRMWLKSFSGHIYKLMSIPMKQRQAWVCVHIHEGP